MDIFAGWLAPFLSSGSLFAFPLVMLGGLITAFNPCCLPMYPAVIGFLGGASTQCAPANQDDQIPGPTSRLMRINFLFVLGMAIATSLMGLLTAMLGWVFGQFDPSFRFLLAIVPLLMGLYLLGWLPFRLPSWHIKSLNNLRRESLTHAITAFVAGFLFSLAIAPCATPILLGILTLVALQGDLFYGAVLMFIYGFGTGLPLLLVGHGLAKAQHLFAKPQLQRWLRQSSGFLLVCVGIYVVWMI